jgi:hypothetical protein
MAGAEGTQTIARPAEKRPSVAAIVPRLVAETKKCLVSASAFCANDALSSAWLWTQPGGKSAKTANSDSWRMNFGLVTPTASAFLLLRLGSRAREALFTRTWDDPTPLICHHRWTELVSETMQHIISRSREGSCSDTD